MPPEPLPWDRKDFVVRERKHDRGPPDGVGGGGGGGGGGHASSTSSFSAPRWRDTYHGPRDFHSPSPRRLLTGYRPVFTDELGSHAVTPSRSEGDNFRCFSGRYGSSSGRNGNFREGRGYFRRSPWNSGDTPRQHQDSLAGSAQRSVPDPLIPASASSTLLSLKEQHDKTNGGVDDGPGTGQGHDRERDHSLSPIAWKPLKWSRSGSFSSSKKAIKSEADGAGVEISIPPGKETPLQSPVISSPPSEEGSARKKPRLGWGQGLAKYEKEKVGGPEDGSGKNLSVQCSSPNLTNLAGSASPATPSSITCSSSRVLEDKLFFSTANNDVMSHVGDSPGHPQDFPIKLEHLNIESLCGINSVLVDLLQPEDVSSGDSNFTRQTALNKLLLLKRDILKLIEKTEAEIDFSECELRNIKSKTDQVISELQIDRVLDTSRKDSVSSCFTLSPDFPSTSTAISSEPCQRDNSLNEMENEAKECEDDSAETITSKFSKSTLTEKGSSDSDVVKLEGHSINIEAMGSVKLETQLPSDVAQTTCSSVACDGMDTIHINPGKDLYSEVGCSLIAQVMTTNRELAREMSEVFCNWSPNQLHLFDSRGSDEVPSSVKEKLASRKRSRRLNEQVVTLKFRALNYLWKEDLRLLSIMKCRSKSQKRNELNSRSLQNGSQKHRSFTRPRFSVSAGNFNLEPTEEIMELTSRLLSHSQIKIYRDYLKMPAFILDENERRCSRFITSNGLVEDPCLVEKEKALLNPWTAEEKNVFLDKLASFGKDFRKISSFLDHKTTADCIEFYYKNHKSESFEAVKKTLNLRKQWHSLPFNSFMVAAGKKWKHEVNAASLDMLGAASEMVAHSNDNRIRQKYTGRSVFGSRHEFKMSRGSVGRTANVEVLAETTAADVLAGIGNSLSSEGMSSCVTSPFFPESSQTIDEEDTCSDEGVGEMESVDWTDEEKSIFIRALGSYGRDFAKISHCLGTRSKEQCKIFFSKARKRLGLDTVHQVLPGNDGEMPLSDANGGRSEIDDACVAEMDSAICSTQSCSKMDDLSQSIVNTSAQEVLRLGCSEQIKTRALLNREVKSEVEKLAFCFNNSGLKAAKREPPLSKEVPEVPSNDSIKPCGEAKLSISCEMKQGNDVLASVLTVTTEEVMKAEQNLEDQTQQTCAGRCLPDKGFKIKLEPPQYVVPTRHHSEIHTVANDSISSSLSSASDTASNENACQRVSKVGYFPGVIFASNHQNQVPTNMLPHLLKNPQMLSWKQKENSALSVKPLFPDLSSINFEGRLETAPQSNFGPEEHSNKKQQISHGREIYPPYLLGSQSLSESSQPLPILRGYPLHVLNRNEMTGDAGQFEQKPVFLQNFPKKNLSYESSQLFVPDLSAEKSKNSRHHVLDPDHSSVPTCNEPADSQLRPCSRGTGTELEEQSLRTGDVKLFGQILSHPSPIQKLHEVEDKPPCNSSSLNQPNARIDGSLHLSAAGTSSHTGSEELPMRTFGFWDGRRIQTGFTSLPESSTILSKYPVGHSNVTYIPTQNNTGDSLPSHQRSLSLDGKRQEVFPELQKWNMFEASSGIQQQGRVAISRISSGGVLLGGGCTGVSDPVAAIKMHYASQARLLGNEEESWRGDIGGR